MNNLKRYEAIIAGGMNEVLEEVARAMVKHPDWPKDMIHQAAIISEESGEMVRAALNYTYEGGSMEEVRKECIQTAATAIRFLIENNKKLP